MELKEAREKLHSTTFLIKRMHHSAALKHLAQTSEPEAMDILAGALDSHSRSEEIRAILMDVQDQRKVDRLWQIWAKSRKKEIGGILKAKGLPSKDESTRIFSLLKLGKTAEVSIDRKSIEKAFNFFNDPDEDVRKGVVEYARILPQSEDANDAIYSAWIRSDSPGLMEVIRSQDRRPSRIEMEGLFYLLSNQVKRYFELEDGSGALFQDVYTVAPEGFRKKLHEVVLKSGDSRLADAYEKALSGSSDFNREVYIEVLKSAGDEAGLLEATRYMALPGLLDLCKRWSESEWLPEEKQQHALVREAVAAYKKVGSLVIESPEAPLPNGVSDLFASWRKQSYKDNEITEGLSAPDPFVRMRSLYLGFERNLLPRERLQSAARSQDWPERLIARLFMPTDGTAASVQDHVAWVNACSGSGELTTAGADCTPVEYEHFGRLLSSIPRDVGGFGGRYRAMVEILHSFQALHTADRITVIEDDGAREKDALEVSDMQEAPSDVDFS